MPIDKSTLLISKDVLRADYLGCYGSRDFKTPHIDELARKGTRFTRFYTAAPSSGMSYTAMFSGMDIHQMDRRYFGNVKQFDQSSTLFQDLEEDGCDTHVVWDKKWYTSSRRKAMVFADSTQFHNLDIAQHVGPHGTYDRDENGRIVKKLDADPVSQIVDEIGKITTSPGPRFIWLHCPHCLAGYDGYGSDIGLFDELVGRLVSDFVGDVILTADHGHMNGEKGICCYGFHVYEGSARIPMITPNYFGTSVVDTPYSNVQIKDLILDRKLRPQEYVYCDSQYYLQLDRKLMIVRGDYKYIFSKWGGTEELYDVKFDPGETVNLLRNSYTDNLRRVTYFLDEVFHYPKWDEAKTAYEELRNEKHRIWRTGTKLGDLAFILRDAKRDGITTLFRRLRRVKKATGKWGAIIKANPVT